MDMTYESTRAWIDVKVISRIFDYFMFDEVTLMDVSDRLAKIV